MMRFGPYELRETLKQRGAVVTSRAHDSESGAPVILKMLQRDGINPALTEALQREFRLIKELDSPRVVSAIDLLWSEDRPAIVLQDHGGQMLHSIMDSGQLSVEDALATGLALARSLKVVHDAGIMHGDITPHNVLVGDTPDNVVLIDFGLSERGGLPARESAGLRGSPDYIAPELTGRLARGADHRADLYSFGILLYQMLAGQLPFSGEELLEKVHAHLALEPAPLRDLVPTAPEAVYQVVERLLRKSPDQRYQTAEGLIDDLTYCLARVRGETPRANFVPGATDIPRKLSISVSLQGRSATLDHLRAAYEQVREGAPCAMAVGIQGPAGVGKSALVQAFRPFVDRSGGLFLICPFETGTPMGQLLNVVAELSQLLLTERFGALSSWRARLRDHLGDTLPILAERVPDLGLLAGKIDPPDALGPRESAERLTRAIRRFLRLCAEQGHPLVLICEDVHLADPAARAVLQGLARTAGPERMLLILTRRSGETTDRPDLVVDREMEVEGLGEDGIAAILAETFRQDPHDTILLARAVREKVGGAPLAVGQFIGSLNDAGHVRFDEDKGAWTWDLAAVRAQDVSENVVELLLQRGQGLSSDERRMFGSIACIGRTFTLTHARSATGADDDTLEDLLERGLAMGWLTPAQGELRFSHERIHSAAEEMLPPGERHAIHAAIAEMLLSNGQAPEGEVLYTAAHHLGKSIGPETAPETIGHALGLNAAAGGVALEQGDLQRGHRHFKSAAAMLSPPAWETDPGGALQVTAGAAGAAVLVGAFDEAETHFETFLERCPDPSARAGIHALRIFSAVGQNKSQEAIEIGLKGLEELGDPLPAMPTPADIEAEVGAIFGALGQHGVEELATWHDAKDEKATATQQLLAALAFPAFSGNPLLFATAAARLVARSVRDGLTEHSVIGFSDFGLTACGPMNQVGLGYGFSQLAQGLVEARGLKGIAPRIHTIFNVFIRHRKEPIRVTLDGLKDAQELSISSGDVNMAALAAFDLAFQHFWIGERLEMADDAFREADDFVSDLEIGIMPDLIALYRQTIEDLNTGNPGGGMLDGNFANGEALLRVYAERRDPNGIAQLHIAQMLLAQMQGARDVALAQGRMAVPALDGITSTPAVPAFYAMFAMLAVPEGDGEVDPEDLAVLQRGAEVTAYWASEAPMNYEHYEMILKAELALAEGDESKWLDLLESAADHATQNGFTRDSAMALERAALVCRTRGRTRRYSHFIRDAWRAWIHYGAESKIAEMASAHASEIDRFATVADEGTGNSVSLSLSDEQLDLGALLRSTRAISQEVRMGELLRALLAGVVEIAGASSALVVAPQGDDFHIVADFSLGTEGTRLADATNGETLGICTPETAPLSALRLVTRLRRPLTTRDVTNDMRLSGDPFFQSDVPASLAVLPLVNGNRLLGLIYLENREIGEAFAGTRLNLLSALCSQAAISWDNASLYDRQAKLLAAADRFVPTELARLFNRDSIVDVQMTDARFNRMTLMVSDLRGSTTSAEQMTPQRTFARINQYLSEFSTAVQSEGGIVLKYMGDGVLAIFPEGTAAALRAAITFQGALDALDWRPEDGQPLGAGIAIHAGEIMFGVVGDGNRMQIDALSDAVNVAFRLESQTRRFGARVLVTEDALAQMDNPESQPTCRYLGEVATLGRQTLNRVHQLVDAEPGALRAAKTRTLEIFEQAVRAMETGDSTTAAQLFSQVLRDNPGDVAAATLFQDAAEQMRSGR